MIDKIDKDIIIYLSKDIELSKNLYKDMAKIFDISEDELINRLKKLNERGYLKRISPIMVHQKSGYDSNAMVVWKVEKDKIEYFIDIIKTINSISHVYERELYPNWDYNLYTMIHGKTKNEVDNIINYLSKSINNNSFKVLYTLKELKKISPNLEELIK
ncbi:MAG: Lrp/AsnC family transcriptional regulator [Tepidibacter sp.]|uniref:siroheme decarboxylase subunit beta n=1 Tax=Tepidibacter sp. TaxID=2529387 RepID=UPI0025EE8F48|nr:Lrp/AsnC family transcriptional regulator [Tepidibacter sp.]MCT4509355.1 Lrp/AsnC family transcriptional regulator [Tepidibacter sp.]